MPKEMKFCKYFSAWKTAVFAMFFLFFHFKTVYQYGADFYPQVARFDGTVVAAALGIAFVLLALFWLRSQMASPMLKMLLLFLAWHLFCVVRCGAFSVQNLLNVMGLVLLSYAMPFVLQGKKGNRLFVGCIIIPYILYRLPAMLYGWYTYLTKIPVYFFDHGPTTNLMYEDTRLTVFWDPNETALTVGLICMLCLYGFWARRDVVTKVFFAISFVVSFITLTLAGSRTTTIALAVAVAAVVAYAIFAWCKQVASLKHVVLVLLGAVLSAALLLMATTPISSFFTAWQSPVPFEETAVVRFTDVELNELATLTYHPENTGATVLGRTSTVEGAFNGREYIWRAGLTLLQQNPSMLLTGAHVDAEQYILKIYQDTGIYYGHMHSSYMHLLLAYGLPGICIFGALVLYLLLRCIYLLFQPRSLSAFVAAATICLILINDTMEPFFVDAFGTVTPIVLLYCCGVVCASTPDFTVSNCLSCLRTAWQQILGKQTTTV